MRKKIVAGNWKMNLTFEEGLELVKHIEVNNASLEVYLFTPNIYLLPLIEATKGKNLSIGAQNGHPEANGAFTGEVSLHQLKQLGVNSVLIGHSERRALFNETESFLKEKVNTALSLGFTIFFCCGETLEQRTSGNHFNVISNQLEDSLLHLSAEAMNKVIIAYEPVWAIGTGKTASTDDAEAMHKHIRAVIAQKYSSEVADKLSILYGGSCKPSNAAALFAQENIDGGLIGGASLKANDFNEIIKAS